MIAMVDCNSFYVSCEYVFRPDLRMLPGVVLSNNDGCAIARNTKAKELGIAMGAPYFEIKKLCKKHNVQVFSSNFSLYTDMSVRVMKVLSQFAPRLEYYSIDESWLDLSGFNNYDLREYAHEIRKRVWQYTGIPVSVGIAPTKVLAKIANHVGKRWVGWNGVCVLDSEKIQNEVLEKFPIQDIWGVGRASPPKFHSLGIKTAKDLKDYKNHNLIQKIFTKLGRQIQDELRGISCRPVTPEGEKKKEIMQSRTFGTPVYDYASLLKAIANYVHTASERMRAQGSVCTQIHTFARTNPFKDVEQYYAYGSHKLNTGTACTLRLTQIAMAIAREMYKPGYEYRKAGIRLIGLKDSSEYQASLFDPGDSKKNLDLMRVMDQINWKEGPQSIKSMACGTSDRAWRMNREHLSSRFTTSWHELPKCK